ncbi:MAG: amino acid ABC transporter ATP-binding protein [Candidatus Scatomorpha sp.]|jgi:polar amino acid transport system ATP-binding protein
MKNVFEITNCKKSFGDLEVLKGITVKVKKGEVCSIIGPSGSGKSTLLRCATLLERMDSGELAYSGDYAAREEDGAAVYAPPQKLKIIKHNFGLVFQNFNLFPHFSVFKNVTDPPLTVLRKDPEYVKEKAVQILSSMGLEDKKDAYPFELSGGQQQRVAIARALCMEPQILFFDEPTSALDPELTGEILSVMRQLAEEDMTMVIVTHEMSFAADISDKVVFMDNGLIVEEGEAELIKNPQNERTRAFLRRFNS